VNHHPISILLSWIKAKEIAIPEIQRPFVWDSTKVRDLIDRNYREARGCQAPFFGINLVPSDTRVCPAPFKGNR
ncbi:MAG: DUF262 domain-containing protein, partial [Treponema sp.]|nr:DUF262 domain-containing protein [Treponema sp.]